jgi:hypothetical protein
VSSNSLSKTTAQVKTRGVPGRVFVFLFVPVLILLLVLTLSMAVRFQLIMNQLAVVRSLWPAASQELKVRYHQIAMLNDDALQNAGLTRDKLTALRSDFDATTQYDTQSIVAGKLESMLQTGLSSLDKELGPWSQMSAVIALEEADRKRKGVQQDWLGWVTITGLRLKLPPIFEP